MPPRGRASRQAARHGSGPDEVLRDFHQSLLVGVAALKDIHPDWAFSRCVAEAYKTMIHRRGLLEPDYFNCHSCWEGGSHEEASTHGPPGEVPEPGAEPEVEEPVAPSAGSQTTEGAFASHQWMATVEQGTMRNDAEDALETMD